MPAPIQTSAPPARRETRGGVDFEPARRRSPPTGEFKSVNVASQRSALLPDAMLRERGVPFSPLND